MTAAAVIATVGFTLDKQQHQRTTVVGPRTKINGSMVVEEDMRVFGQVEGQVSATQTVYVEPSAACRADISAKTVMITGQVIGNVSATELIQIGEEGSVVGDLTAPRIVLADGATLRGKLDIGPVTESAAKDLDREFVRQERSFERLQDRNDDRGAYRLQDLADDKPSQMASLPLRPPTIAGRKAKVRRR